MTTAQDQQSRAEFVALADSLGYDTTDLGHGFCHAATRKVFKVWQAARALPAAEPVAWIEHDEGGVAYMPYYDAARKLPGRVKFDLFTAAQVQAMGRVPPGWQAVPVEPTEQMRKAGYDAYGVDGCYAAMLAAAPRPPAAQEGA